jgi:hypothetical protein
VRISRLTAAAAAAAAVAVPVALASSGGANDRTVTVTHGPVKLVYTDLGPKGPSVGDMYSANVLATGPGPSLARVVGTLTTVAEDTPVKGKEIRTTKLVFVFADPNDQIEIGGASTYSKTAPTRPKASTTIRPIVGGSGKYAGASGWAVSVHYKNGNWSHTFHLTNS